MALARSAHAAADFSKASWHDRNARRWAYWRKHLEDILKELDEAAKADDDDNDDLPCEVCEYIRCKCYNEDYDYDASVDDELVG